MEEKNKLEAIKEIYAFSFQEKISNYEQLALNIKSNLESLLQQNSIEFMEVNYRIKTFDSFCEKILRKEKDEKEEEKEENKTLFEKIQDICGIRIICYYVTDLKEIDTIIRENFEIIDSEYKNEKLKENEFGYLSNHYIVKIKDTWAELPVFNNLNEYEVEIQVRTILMHAWADISHKLNYKQKNIDRDFERKLNRLSALFEIADNLFISLKNERQEKYSEEIKKDNVVQEYNIDFMRAALKEFVKMEVTKSSDESIEKVIKILERYGIQPMELLNYLKIIKKDDLEKIFKKLKEENVYSFDKPEETVYFIITSLVFNTSLYEKISGHWRKVFEHPEIRKVRDSYKIS